MRRKVRSRSKQNASLSLETRLQRLREAGRVAVVQGKLKVAEEAYSQAVALGTKEADVYNNLATIYDKWDVKRDEEIALLTRAHELAPDDCEIRNNLFRILNRETATLLKEERYREALPLVQRKVEMEPASALAQRDLGYCYWKTGKLDFAAKHFTRAINLEPDKATYYNDLGLVCFEMRWLSEAQGAFQEVLRLNPDSAVAYTHLGLLANLTGLTGLAVGFMRRALEKEPNCSEARNNIALFLRDQGEQAECRHHYQEAIRLKPDNANVISGYLLSLNDDPHADPAWIANEHLRYQEVVKGTRRVVQPRDRDPSRKLRIGYLSPDFRSHSVAFFIAPVIEQHDRNCVEVTCYSTGHFDDDITARIRAAADCYRDVYRTSDDDLAQMIQADGIDILVELSGHTCDNRLTMLANRVAPVQVTYLGYPNTTGLSEMDYRVTDAVADPPGKTEALHTEKLVRIAGGFLAYQPPDMARGLEVAESPVRKAGHVTFGSFNNLAKINEVVLDTWAEILEKVPTSVILLKGRGLRNDKVKERIVAAFTTRGIEGEERIRLMGHARSAVDHLRLYNEMDLALDTFPYNGTTTTCEALWMGTPVLTFEGVSHAGRVGSSLLAHAGLGDLVAKDREGYIAKAVELGGDPEGLTKLRSRVRATFASSAAMDARRLACGLERAYREAWTTYCERVD